MGGGGGGLHYTNIEIKDKQGSIAEKCFDIWGILKMAPVKSVEPGNNSFSINHILRCRSKLSHS